MSSEAGASEDIPGAFAGTCPCEDGSFPRNLLLRLRAMAQIRRAEGILSREGIQVSAVRNHYSLLYRSSEKADILDYCRKNGTDFHAYARYFTD